MGHKRHRGNDLRARRGIAILVFILALICALAARLLVPRVAWWFFAGAAVLLLGECVLLVLKHRLPLWLYITVGALCGGLLLVGPHYVSLVPYGDGYISTETTYMKLTEDPPENFCYLTRLEELDLTNSTITDFEQFHNFTHLKKLDVRGNYAFTKNERVAFAMAQPDCDVLWSVWVIDQYYDSDTVKIDLTDRDLSVSEIEAVIAEYPGCKFVYRVNIFEQRVDQDCTAITLPRSELYSRETLDEALRLLPDVMEIDLTAKPLYADAIASLKADYPQITFHFSFDLPNTGAMKEDSQWVTVDAQDYEGVLTYAAFFPYAEKLKTVDCRTVPLTEEQATTLMETYPDLRFLYTFELFGETVTSLDTTLNLSKKEVTDIETVERYLKFMPNLQAINMCDCGLSNATLAEFRSAHPEMKIFWRVYFGVWSLRTDAEVFTTYLWADNSYNFGSSDFEPLQYCTDLLFLDLGHNEITSIEALSKLTKLRVLILADNNIKDISPLENLNDLEYVELFTNYIRDVSPLANKTKLLDLNLGCNWLESGIEELATCTNLERLWVGNCKISTSKLKALKKALPDCTINTSAGNNPTGAGWRNHERHTIIKKMYNTREYIPFD